MGVIQYEKDLTIAAGSEDGVRGPAARECKWLLEAGKGRKMNFLQELPERNGALPAS